MKEFESKKMILELLRKNKDAFISGEEMSAALGFSRAGVWKYIKKLREDGYEIDAATNSGYRLISSPDKVYGFDISGGLGTSVMGKQAIYYFDSVGSTNDAAYEIAEKGAAEGTVVVAEKQTKGKGRIGREWISPESGGIYMSIVLRPDMETDEIPSITLVAALAIIRAIKKVCGIDAGMKWPNDILIGDKKVSGILTEIKAQPDRVDFLVLGVGVNVNTSPGDIPPEATSLKEASGNAVDRSELVRKILEDFERSYSRLRKEGFKGLRDECKAMSLVIGNYVKVKEHTRAIEGLAADIDEKGALIIRTDTGLMQRVFSGDVVLCRGVE
jgi:BirA family biotin operon repressor/biotin-[acetyl-CoA-carboxylase] ligase